MDFPFFFLSAGGSGYVSTSSRAQNTFCCALGILSCSVPEATSLSWRFAGGSGISVIAREISSQDHFGEGPE